jgi:hypothetical protein
MKNQIINGGTNQLIVTPVKYYEIVGDPQFLSISLILHFAILLFMPITGWWYITIRPASSYGKKRSMLKFIFFFLLGAVASVVVFFTPWWLPLALIILLILFRLVKAEFRWKEHTRSDEPLHHRRSIQKLES